MKIKALEPFLDGNILARKIDRDQVVEVTQREYEMIKQSGGDFEVVPDETEVTPLPVELNKVAPPLTEKELAAKQLREQQEFEAKQLREQQDVEAQTLVNEDEPELVMNVTATDEAQATRAAEELTAKKIAEKEGAERQAAADKVAKEVESEVAKEIKSEPVARKRSKAKSKAKAKAEAKAEAAE